MFDRTQEKRVLVFCSPPLSHCSAIAHFFFFFTCIQYLQHENMAKAHNPHHTEAHIITSIFQAVRWGGLDGKRISFGAKYFSFFFDCCGDVNSLLSRNRTLFMFLLVALFSSLRRGPLSVRPRRTPHSPLHGVRPYLSSLFLGIFFCCYCFDFEETHTYINNKKEFLTIPFYSPPPHDQTYNKTTTSLHSMVASTKTARKRSTHTIKTLWPLLRVSSIVGTTHHEKKKSGER